MNGVHDMGGMHGFGSVAREADEPVFHEAWEGRIFAVALALSAWRAWNGDQSRFAQERLPPAQYLSSSYYERWLSANEKLLLEANLISAEELAAGQVTSGAAKRTPALRAAKLPGPLLRRCSARIDASVPAKFSAGDRVRARNINPPHHTRLPRYARGKCGLVFRAHGVFAFPDTNAQGLSASPQHLYSVCFRAAELWGPEAPTNDRVYIDMWEAYLEPA